MKDISESNFPTHEVHCKKLQLCDLCGERVPELEQHCLEEHALEPCDFCGENIPKDQLDAHKVLWRNKPNCEITNYTYRESHFIYLSAMYHSY